MDVLDKAKKAAKRFVDLRLDSWTNPFTGLGTTERDKMRWNTFEAEAGMEADYADELYCSDDMAARICDTMPEQSFRRGVEVKIDPDKDDSSGIEDTLAEVKDAEKLLADELKRLDVCSKFTEAAVWGNVFGGCAIWIGRLDGAEGYGLAQPVNENAIKSVDFLHVIDKRYLMPQKWYTDPSSEKYGTPETYLFTPENTTSTGNYEIHESRLIMFGGIRTSNRKKAQRNGWDLSLLDRINHTLMQFGVSWDGLAHMISDANQAVFKMSGLMDALAAGDSNTIQQRMALIDMSRAVSRAIVLDTDSEDFDRKNFSWSGIKEPFNLLMYRLSAAARLPVTVLMGRSPEGMNATGESDERNFYDQVESYRNEKFVGPLERMVGLIFNAKEGPTRGKEPENWRVQFPSLWSMTPKQEAEIYEINARGDLANVNAGILLPEEIALSRFGPDSDAEISIDMNARLMPEDEEIVEPNQEIPDPGTAEESIPEPTQTSNREEGSV